jgi:hypothetical protein
MYLERQPRRRAPSVISAEAIARRKNVPRRKPKNTAGPQVSPASDCPNQVVEPVTCDTIE